MRIVLRIETLMWFETKPHLEIINESIIVKTHTYIFTGDLEDRPNSTVNIKIYINILK